MRLRYLALLVVLAVVVGVGVATWRGQGPLGALAHRPGCTATLDGHRVDLSTEQAENATLIAAVGVRRGLPARAVSIALATAYQESKIHNLTHGDRDSLGLFQQRPSQGWGTARQVRDPFHATNAFYDALVEVRGYETMRITEAAQKVQRSGFPEAYQDHAPDARALASVLTGYSAGGLFTCVVAPTSERGSATRVVSLVRRAYGDLDAAPTGVRQDVRVQVPSGAPGRRLGWSVAQFVVAHGGRLHPASVTFAGRRWRTGEASDRGWARSGRVDRATVSISLG